jgi:hypothetical protein
MGIHSHTLDPETRLSEARHTARCSIDLSAGPALMLGDRNSVFGVPAGRPWAHLPAEDDEPDWRRLPRELLPYHLLLDEYGDPVLDEDGNICCDRRPSKVLAVAGFRDPVAELIDEPAARPRTGGWGPGDAERRIDGIYGRGLTSIHCDTPRSPDVDALSDHRPVVADFDLDAAAPA